jgi:hypothetical protein
MKHSVSDLFDVVYQFYPRGQWIEHPEYGLWPILLHQPLVSSPESRRDLPFQVWPPPGYEDTEEQHRLSAARKKASAEMEQWRRVLRRIDARFPGYAAENRSLHLPTGKCDGCYSGWFDLPVRKPAEYRYGLGFLASFLVPYYVIYSGSAVEYHDEMGRLNLSETEHFFPEEKPYAPMIAEEICAAFEGYEPMPPEIGNIAVPEAVTDFRFMDRATIYDCLFTPLNNDAADWSMPQKVTPAPQVS